MHGTIWVTHIQAIGLREAVRPLNCPPNGPIDPPMLIALHEKILLVLVEFETQGVGTADIVLTRDDILFINQFLSVQDGDWAADILKQARRALYEIRTGVLPGWAGASDKLFADVAAVVDGEKGEDTKSGGSGAE